MGHPESGRAGSNRKFAFDRSVLLRDSTVRRCRGGTVPHVRVSIVRSVCLRFAEIHKRDTTAVTAAAASRTSSRITPAGTSRRRNPRLVRRVRDVGGWSPGRPDPDTADCRSDFAVASAAPKITAIIHGFMANFRRLMQVHRRQAGCTADFCGIARVGNADVSAFS